MSRLQSIENAISEINPIVFQELCDTFLSLRNTNYSAFSRSGSESGKQKAAKGTPDAFFLLPNGKYIFVEHSTNESERIKKIKDDIKKCINTNKTGIPVEKIAEIIICVNYNLKPSEIEKLNVLLKDIPIVLTIHMLDSLAMELHRHHRDLAHEYLNISLDTGQIVSIDTFVNEYNKASKGIATPLDNVFVHRETELKELKESIKKFDFVILTGSAGVGKTKLGLETIESFLKENLDYQAYCISYKHHFLLDDLHQYITDDKNYILFVDDANRIDAFSQITGFYKSIKKGNLKIIITVRDYAFHIIEKLCWEFSHNRINIEKFLDEQIVDIIESKSFEIRNPDYQKEIVRIADGNPRLAIMSSLLAKEKQNIHVLYDLSDLFESYFSTFINDDGEFANPINIKSLGIISFFYAIPYKNKDITIPILKNFGLGYDEFIDSIDILDKLELVEIHFNQVKIPEQNLSAFFFNKVFIKDNLLSFQVLLEKYFESNKNRFWDCVVPVHNTFGTEKVIKKLKPELKSYWNKIKNDESKSISFLTTFWYFMGYDTLDYIYNYIQSLPPSNNTWYKVSYEMNEFSYDKDKIIKLLGEFFRFYQYLKESFQLAVEYVRKLPNNLPELIHKIRAQLTFDREDYKFNFQRQIIIFEVLIDALKDNDLLYTSIFFEISKTFLAFSFHQTKGGRKGSIVFYDYPIPNNTIIQGFRERIWNAIDSKFSDFHNKSFELLESYIETRPDVNKDIMEFDIPFLINIIDNHLINDSFEHCKFVQELIHWCKRNSVFHNRFTKLKEKYTNSIYEIYLKIDWNQYRDKDDYEFSDYREYERLKIEEIRSSFIFNSTSEIQKFYNTFISLFKLADREFNYKRTYDIVVDENCSANFDLGLKLLEHVIKNENEINYIPEIFFLNHLKTEKKASVIWGIIQKSNFKYKILWQLSFFDYLDDSLVNKNYLNELITSINHISESINLRFNRIKRFLNIKPDLFQIILKTVVEKNQNENLNIHIWDDVFKNYFDQLGNNLELIKTAYLQQDKLQQSYDYQGKGMLHILEKDEEFLIEFTDSLYAGESNRLTGFHKDLGFIWQIETIERTLKNVFDKIIEKESYYGILEHFCNSFFMHLDNKYKERAEKFLLDYAKDNCNNVERTNVIVDIARYTMKHLFEKVLIQHISLNQDVNIFSKIWWRGNGGSYVGEVITGDIEAADWRRILSIIEESDIGIKLLPIKKFVNEKIDSCLRHGEREREFKFLEHS